eukprot:1093016-Pelagomonas_calceolata.AAC.2
MRQPQWAPADLAARGAPVLCIEFAAFLQGISWISQPYSAHNSRATGRRQCLVCLEVGGMGL